VGDLSSLICSVKSGNISATGTTPMVKIAIVALLISFTFSQPLFQNRLYLQLLPLVTQSNRREA
jgi:hypothetical protein